MKTHALYILADLGTTCVCDSVSEVGQQRYYLTHPERHLGRSALAIYSFLYVHTVTKAYTWNRWCTLRKTFGSVSGHHNRHDTKMWACGCLRTPWSNWPSRHWPLSLGFPINIKGKSCSCELLVLNNAKLSNSQVGVQPDHCAFFCLNLMAVFYALIQKLQFHNKRFPNDSAFLLLLFFFFYTTRTCHFNRGVLTWSNVVACVLYVCAISFIIPQ